MKNNLQNTNKSSDGKLDWEQVQLTMKDKFGTEIYDSWLKKIELIDEFNNYILVSVSTRFIRDWITSRYLDQIIQVLKNYKKEIVRIEIIISENKTNESNVKNLNKQDNFANSEKVSFIKDSFLQYNRIDPNKNFNNFLTGPSNKLAFEAAKKVTEQLAYYNPLYIYSGVGMG